ncbi:PQQ-binding-like beta-propeller repeat protein [Acidobacteriota bacterium]
MLKRRIKEISDKTAHKKHIRLWPGVVIVLLQWLARYIMPMVIPGSVTVGVFAGLFGGVAIIIWWAFFSRAHRIERWGAVVLMIVALFAARPFLHKSIATAGMGMLFPIYAIPILSLAFVIWAVASRSFSVVPRRVAMVAVILLASGFWILLQTGGITNNTVPDFSWRWKKTPEELLLAQTSEVLKPLPSSPVSIEPGFEWLGFRGPFRDSVIRGVQIQTNWSESPPNILWKRPVGPGWSSFAVRGNLFYTQEQRGEDEFVSCYSVTTGEPVWQHSDKARFWESNGGAGPRGTPTISAGHLYTFGGTGILNVLDAADGGVVWSRNAASDTNTKVPIWGFSSSPLVLDDSVIVAAAGSLISYDITTGNLRWSIPSSGDCYSSPHLMYIDGVEQILLLNSSGVISVLPSDGTLIWEYLWPGTPIVQPTQIEGGDILISVDERGGVRRIKVNAESDGWTVKELWTSVRLKPYFNDSVIHNGYAYGFDGPILACIDIEDGQRKWKGGRYGRGQFILLSDQDLLLVLSEKGELALVEATPEQFTELERFPAIEGKTWNHPVLVGNVLLVRNGQEMMAFQVSLENE